MPPIIEELQGKRIAILGFGREGKSTYAYIRRYLPDQPLTIADQADIDTTSLTHVNTIVGADYQKLNDFDVVMKSPGIVLQESIEASKLNSQTNLFLKYYGKQTIGITGTKGKSTTSSLLYHILKEQGKDVVFLGNIGKPAFDELENIKESTLVVYELSCHQLEYTHHDPHWGVLLNIFEEHLDHYGTYEKYIHAKENIWRLQSSEDILICEQSLIKEEMNAHVISASMHEDTADLIATLHGISLFHEECLIQPQDTPLLGHHNMYDIAIVFCLVNQLGISYEQALAALKTFQPLPHRLQYVGYIQGLHWYDDSISTICETTIQALKSLPKTDTLLLGGMDRGIDYQPLAQYLNEHPVSHVILMPDSGQVIAGLLKIPYTCVKDLKEAVACAKQVSQPDSVVLLSPAAASYGFFQNFEERGDKYQAYIKE